MADPTQYTMHVTTTDCRAEAKIVGDHYLLQRFEAYLIGIGAEWNEDTYQWVLPESFNLPG